mgnify:FL=1
MPANPINNIRISEISENQIPDIQKIANEAWPVTFAEILTQEQIRYMMGWMYSQEALVEQFGKGHRFFLAESDGEYLGFMSIENNSQQSGRTKIHKAYIRPAFQGEGIGRAFFDRASNEAVKRGDDAIYLNVNKQNLRAIAFYEKYGMAKIKEEIIDIGNGFVMDDYVFEKRVG